MQWRLEPKQIKESGMRNMIQAAHRVTDHISAVIEEMMNSQGPDEVATKGNLIIKTTDRPVKRVLQITVRMIAMTAATVENLGNRTRLKTDTIHWKDTEVKRRLV